MYRCELISDHKRFKKNRVSIERSQITRRFPMFASPNLQKRTFALKLSNYTTNLTLFISNRTNRTIEKHGGLNPFLLKIKKQKLSNLGRQLQKQLKTEIYR